MARCHNCNKWILGGIREGTFRYCSTECHEDGFLVLVVESIDLAILDLFVNETHKQPCVICGHSGPVDLYTKYTVTSLIFYFSWSDSPTVCCRQCGVKRILRGFAWTFLFGWWSLPFGVVATPWQLSRSVRQLCPLPNPSLPSEQLRRMLMIRLANDATPTTTLRFRIILGESYPLQPDDRFVAADGAIYRLESIEQADRIDVLPIAQVVRVSP
jgi:hypothetical protein